MSNPKPNQNEKSLKIPNIYTKIHLLSIVQKEETLSSLRTLNSLVQAREKEMKKMLEKDIRYLEYYKDEQETVWRCSDENGDSYSDDDEDWKPKMDEMYQFFYDMIKNIESLPRNNFKKSAEIEMKKMIEIASEMRENRDSEISLKFSFC